MLEGPVPDNTLFCANTMHGKRSQNDSLTSPSVRSNSLCFGYGQDQKTNKNI